MAEELATVVVDLRPRLSRRSAEKHSREFVEAMRRHPSFQADTIDLLDRRACVVTPLRLR
ncbi:hypothetical protein [Mycolicibacterium confluentis]|uniref:Uncharacterized protein n=1 Tax=Mycolicibacterium confluentis TaxID=28047 RepID=A0A7I7Y0Q8_9MYCO|nr:hypothetical protein [Mycolicibacterium confluentis]MCV7319717.1 hypothetical protein [Mycolicibacterium confluentis]ORV34310.1 hypothetical protein AWB99_01365 [Mycolicibacterium confluentis]BBZ34743.1 hypothetical protein MCNF_33480 [Mycolicibacterium confluentis]